MAKRDNLILGEVGIAVKGMCPLRYATDKTAYNPGALNFPQKDIAGRARGRMGRMEDTAIKKGFGAGENVWQSDSELRLFGDLIVLNTFMEENTMY